MDPSGYCAGGYGRTSSVRGKRLQPGDGSSDTPPEPGSSRQGRAYGQRSLNQRQPQHFPGYPHSLPRPRGHQCARRSTPDKKEIDKAFNLLRAHPEGALEIADTLLDRQGASNPVHNAVVQLKSRALLQLNRADDCIAFINALGTAIENDNSLLLTKARALQTRGCLHEALPLFRRLYESRRASYKDDKTHGLALGRNLQLMGGADNLKQAMAIYTGLRTRAAGGQPDTPCNDKTIELSLGRLLQQLGGQNNLERGLAIYTRLRRQAAGGRANTPCNDKDIELTLGRHLQVMGGDDNLKQALAIYTRLRTLAAGGLANSPCNDKHIELSLGRLLQLMGGKDNLQQALAIFTRLRTRAAGGREHTPCDDKDI